MSTPIRIVGDFPPCAEPGCKDHALDGYCLASCCEGTKAFCHRHTHRPQLVLDALGYHHERQAFARADMLRLARAMWMGAGTVIEATGYFQLLREVKAKREAEGKPTDGLEGIGE